MLDVHLQTLKSTTSLLVFSIHLQTVTSHIWYNHYIYIISISIYIIYISVLYTMNRAMVTLCISPSLTLNPAAIGTRSKRNTWNTRDNFKPWSECWISPPGGSGGCCVPSQLHGSSEIVCLSRLQTQQNICWIPAIQSPPCFLIWMPVRHVQYEGLGLVNPTKLTN